ncbi:MAG: hypothetical protein N3E52_05870 [Candidatus Bathyarchaeota archaeon]|nr:hypothetical protein [Candidatus Bathyarchaeota archaeon]
MSEEKLERLAKEAEELLVVLGKISEDLRTLVISIKSTINAPLAQPVPQSPPQPAVAAAAPVTHEKKKSLEDIRIAFPEDLEDMLSFEDKGDYIIVKPRQFLGSENFARIASTVRGMGGEYISAGKASHFRVPKK